MKRLGALALGFCLMAGTASAYTVSTAVTVTNSSASALVTGKRSYLALLNQDSAKTIACSLGGTAVVNGAGSITLAPGGGFVWDVPAAVPADAINCIASQTGATLTILTSPVQ